MIAGASATLVNRSEGLLTCAYRAGQTSLRVTLDSAPQAAFRFERAVVEAGQAHLGRARAQLPQQVLGIGRGAAWLPAQRELLATDDRRLVTVYVLSQPPHPAADRAVAVAAARAVLG
ncbi:MAG TPA: hypothetical protein VGM91_12025 [Conexibacter sp.]